MIRSLAMAAAVAAATAASPAAAQDADVGMGLYAANCAACHSISPGVNRAGPSLAGVIDRRAASVPGFEYSSAMRDSGIVWTGPLLADYLATGTGAGGGDQLVHGVAMHFRGLGAEARADLIAFLERL